MVTLNEVCLSFTERMHTAFKKIKIKKTEKPLTQRWIVGEALDVSPLPNPLCNFNPPSCIRKWLQLKQDTIRCVKHSQEDVSWWCPEDFNHMKEAFQGMSCTTYLWPPSCLYWRVYVTVLRTVHPKFKLYPFTTYHFVNIRLWCRLFVQPVDKYDSRVSIPHMWFHPCAHKFPISPIWVESATLIPCFSQIIHCCLLARSMFMCACKRSAGTQHICLFTCCQRLVF